MTTASSQVELLEQGGQVVGGPQPADALGPGGGQAVAPHVDGQHPEVLAEQVQQRRPGLGLQGDAVHQDERAAVAPLDPWIVPPSWAVRSKAVASAGRLVQRVEVGVGGGPHPAGQASLEQPLDDQ